jgi:Ca-activated chloride channel family protein
MVKRAIQYWCELHFMWQFLLITVLAGGVLVWMNTRVDGFADLWFTRDQQARYAFEHLEFPTAAEKFEDPAWKGVARYRSGQYVESAASFGRLGTAEGFFNRGNAFMKGREYAKAITAFEQAVTDAPKWTEARENLQLARYTLDYLEEAREQGGESEIGADDYVFDNNRKRGQETEITRESAIEAQSAEKWMRSVNTDTRDFLRTRFLLEASKGGKL